MSNKKIIWALAVIGICAFYTACILTNQIIGNGDIITSERTVSAFEEVNHRGAGTVYYHASDEYRVTVTIDENLDEFVEIITKDNVLNIGTKSGSYSFTKFVVDVYCPVLTGVSVSGSGNFMSSDRIVSRTFSSTVSGSGSIGGVFECESFYAKISGSGKIDVAGNSKDADISISGSGKFSGSDFEMENADVRVSGSGNAAVYVTNNLKANISGSGGINYGGEPKTINSNVSGSGNIRKM